MGWKRRRTPHTARRAHPDSSPMKNHVKELKNHEQPRIGRPYTLIHSIIKLLTAIPTSRPPYRQLEGSPEHSSTRTRHAHGDYSGLRRRILNQPVDPYRDLKETTEPGTIAVDSTASAYTRPGDGWRGKQGKKRRYIKLHFAVNVVTHEVVAWR